MTPQIIQAGFLAADIPTITERIAFLQRVSHRTHDRQQFAPRIVLEFYHRSTAAVNRADSIALQVRFPKSLRLT